MAKIAARILVVDDDTDVLTAARVVLRQKFEQVETEDNPVRLHAHLRSSSFDAIVLDMNFSLGRSSGNEGLFWLKEILKVNPNMPVILITAYSDVQLAVAGMKIGAADFLIKPWTNEKLETAIEDVLKKRRSRPGGTAKNERSEAAHEVIGESSAMKKLITAARRVAETDANVLILGENGSGKEVIARFIHAVSRRSEKPFVKVDVGAIPATLFESELFGHKKGAFTDARQDRKGMIQAANEGTLFLDEIGNLTTDLQSKLLSVLQNRQVIPLGSSSPLDIDIRLITATNANIHRKVDEGSFRQDLLFRINTVELTVPPLRERPEDIPVLAHHFMKMYNEKYRQHKTITELGIEGLLRRTWPGNVRELQHAIERAVIMSDENVLSLRDFTFTEEKINDSEDLLNLDHMERKAIVAAIQKYNGNMSKVAKELGVGRTTLYRKIARYGLSK